MKNRKQLRKEKRKEKKQLKNYHYTNRNKSNLKLNSETEKTVQKQIKPNKLNVIDLQTKELKKEKDIHKKLQKNMLKQRKKLLLEANLDEDRNIKQLEKQLNLNKRKAKTIPKTFVNDGLDFLLEMCDPENRESVAAAEKHFDDLNDEFEDDFALVTGSKVNKTKINENEDKIEDLNKDDDSMNEMDDEFSGDDSIEEFKGENRRKIKEFDEDGNEDSLEETKNNNESKKKRQGNKNDDKFKKKLQLKRKSNEDLNEFGEDSLEETDESDEEMKNNNKSKKRSQENKNVYKVKKKQLLKRKSNEDLNEFSDDSDDDSLEETLESDEDLNEETKNNNESKKRSQENRSVDKIKKKKQLKRKANEDLDEFGEESDEDSLEETAGSDTEIYEETMNNNKLKKRMQENKNVDKLKKKQQLKSKSNEDLGEFGEESDEDSLEDTAESDEETKNNNKSNKRMQENKNDDKVKKRQLVKKKSNENLEEFNKDSLEEMAESDEDLNEETKNNNKSKKRNQGNKNDSKVKKEQQLKRKSNEDLGEFGEESDEDSLEETKNNNKSKKRRQGNKNVDKIKKKQLLKRKSNEDRNEFGEDSDEDSLEETVESDEETKNNNESKKRRQGNKNDNKVKKKQLLKRKSNEDLEEFNEDSLEETAESDEDLNEETKKRSQGNKNVDKVKKKQLLKRKLNEDLEEFGDLDEEFNEDDSIGQIKNNKSKKIKQEIHVGKKKKQKLIDSEEYGSDDHDDSEANSEESNEEETWEDIYGRIRNKSGDIVQNNTGKYVPPALRGNEGETTKSKLNEKQIEKLLKLKRQLKGSLNRLAESNMHSIATQIEEMYMSNSRNDMNETFAQLIFDALLTSSPVLTPERLLLEHVALITILHANVGSEVGAHFLQRIVETFNQLYYSNDQPIENKQLDNAVHIIGQLYNFKIFNSQLLYEILDKLIEKFEEKHIECIILVLKNIGFTLRKDDPIALKQLILSLQKKAVTVSDNNSRVKYMLDILLAIKNNNLTKIPNYDTTYSEHLKKTLKNFIRKGNYVTQLNISLEDLLKAHERGKWWIVGSAWTGVNESDQKSKKEEEENVGTTDQNQKQKENKKLLELARKQRMNTDTRRSIFCTLMTAENYTDAFEKLLTLGLKNQQEREIIHVLLHCVLQEKHYNPYYGMLAQKFCEYDRKYQMIFRCSFWDKLKSLTECSTRQISTLARLLTHLFLNQSLPISILKVIQFSELDQTTLRLIRQVLIGILLHPDEGVSVAVFQKVALSPKLKMFRESLRLFIHHFLLRNLSSSDLTDQHRNLLSARIKSAEKLLNINENRIIRV